MDSAMSKESEKKLAILPSFNVEINLARAASDPSASPDIDGHLATVDDVNPRIKFDDRSLLDGQA